MASHIASVSDADIFAIWTKHESLFVVLQLENFIAFASTLQFSVKKTVKFISLKSTKMLFEDLLKV